MHKRTGVWALAVALVIGLLAFSARPALADPPELTVETLADGAVVVNGVTFGADLEMSADELVALIGEAAQGGAWAEGLSPSLILPICEVLGISPPDDGRVEL